MQSNNICIREHARREEVAHLGILETFKIIVMNMQAHSVSKELTNIPQYYRMELFMKMYKCYLLWKPLYLQDT